MLPTSPKRSLYHIRARPDHIRALRGIGLCHPAQIGMAIVIIPATRIRWHRSSSDDSISGGVEAVEAKTVQDTVLPVGGEDSTPHAL